DGAEEGLEQAVEHARLGPLAPGSAVGADQDAHLDRVRIVDTVLLGVGLLQMILSVALVALEALDERVDEGREVAGGLPHRRREDDRGVQADDVVAPLDHRPPPLALDVLLELDAQRAVVPSGAGTAVDIAALVHEAAALAER